LAKELQKEFPGVQGFSTRNHWLMRNFYLEYSSNPICNCWLQKLAGRRISSLCKNVKTLLNENVAAKAQNDGTVPAFFLHPGQVPGARSSGCTLHKIYQ
jgi:hypothetical protein